MNNHGKILFVDDNREFIKATRIILEETGFEVIEAYNGSEALKKAKSCCPDLVLLDINMPGMSGLEICRKLREDPETRDIMIIMLTGKESVEGQITGIETGADDYILKSADTRLLYAKIRSFFRKSKSDEKNDHIKIDYDSRDVYVDGEQIKLRPKEFELLYLLKTNEGKVFDKTRIKQNIWGDQYLTDHTVEETMRSMKKKLGSRSKFIETVHGVGYKYAEEKN